MGSDQREKIVWDTELRQLDPRASYSQPQVPRYSRLGKEH